MVAASFANPRARRRRESRVVHLRMRLLLLAAASIASIGCAHAEASSPPSTAPPPAVCAPSAALSSAFELAVLGSGGPVSSGRAASGYVVFIDGVPRALVDVGPGAFERLGEMGIG